MSKWKGPHRYGGPWYGNDVNRVYFERGAKRHFTTLPRIGRFNKLVVSTVWDGVFHGRFADRDHALQIYRDHIAYVKATAQSDQLLVFEAKDGWEPLCRFLDVPVPENDYPHLNDAAQIRRVIRGVRIAGWLAPVALAAGLGALLISWL